MVCPSRIGGKHHRGFCAPYEGRFNFVSDNSTLAPTQTAETDKVYFTRANVDLRVVENPRRTSLPRATIDEQKGHSSEKFFIRRCLYSREE